MKSFFFLAACLLYSVFSYSQPNNGGSGQLPHLEKQGTATRLVVEGKPMLLLSGEMHNSSTGGFAYMRPLWKQLADKHLNAVIAPVSWELIEPVQDRYDFALADSIITGARLANLKVVLIWFGSWKNAGSVYIPSWVKHDYAQYPRAKDEHGKTLEILSTLGTASMNADAKAFAALMRHVKETDSQQQTVIMVQVENEVGVLDHLGETPGNARRDFSVPANTAYNGPVPAVLTDYLLKHKDSLFPELHKVWSANGFKTTGSWEAVFGKSEFRPDVADWRFYSYYTEELFMAYNYARYIGQVAAAGKKEYAIPMFVNAWQKNASTAWPGRYPSGGGLPQVLDVWRAAAPAIDFISPDIYTDDFKWICEEYTRSHNPLFIPEARGGAVGAARAWYVFGEFNGGCFSPFGIDDENNNDTPLEETYGALQKMAPIILANQGKGTMRGILVDSVSRVQQFEMGGYRIEAHLAGRQGIAGGLIIQTGPQEFIVAGKGLDVFFVPTDNALRVAVDAVEEGTFTNGKWIGERRLNGDEVHASTWDGTGVQLPGKKVSMQQVSLYRYK